MTTTIQARIDAESKEQAKKILDFLGLTMSEAISLYFRQIILCRGIPFDIKIPNKATLEAMHELEAGKGKKFATAKAMFEDLKH
ncbi:MAG: type II toxin-antitoxin system RelB/DinJ family antitoxin [Sedimentisphaerales bacterium]|nr:type II toxin-antitoxin system RelB/DinJ family antitoxin [Sedimentisphaerales bacterium]